MLKAAQRPQLNPDYLTLVNSHNTRICSISKDVPVKQLLHLYRYATDHMM